VFLSFRDLMEVRIADKFISYGLSPQRVRAAIQEARSIIGDQRPLSTNRFRTDGREIFLRVVEMDERGEQREHLLNLFRRQYEFKQIIEPLLKSIDFDEQGAPRLWWPQGHRGHIVVDPARASAKPIDATTSVPTAVLATAGRYQGLQVASQVYRVPEASVRRAMLFEDTLQQKAAA